MTAVVDDFTQLNAEFETASPQAVLAWASDTYGDSLAVATSFQPTGIVILHMLSELRRIHDVLTLDTGLLFPETYQLMDALEARLDLRLIRVRPEQTVAEQAATYGADLWTQQPDLCCSLRKVVPLADALVGYDAWVSGLRRDQSRERGTTPVVSWDKRHGRVKLAPLATWTESMIWTYIQAHELPYNTLHDRNYPSIGCVPCTRSVAPDMLDKRAGRWTGHMKTECGIHLTTL